jgi:hypothetical protein
VSVPGSRSARLIQAGAVITGIFKSFGSRRSQYHFHLPVKSSPEMHNAAT